MELQPHEIGNLRALRDGETHAAFGAEMMGIAGLEDTAKILKGAIAVERDRLLATPHDFSSTTGLRRRLQSAKPSRQVMLQRTHDLIQGLSLIEKQMTPTAKEIFDMAASLVIRFFSSLVDKAKQLWQWLKSKSSCFAKHLKPAKTAKSVVDKVLENLRFELSPIKLAVSAPIMGMGAGGTSGHRGPSFFFVSCPS